MTHALDVNSRYDSLIQYCCKELSGKDVPIPWTLVKAMVEVGSHFDPLYDSPQGRGLMALPELVVQEYKLRTTDVFNVEKNLELGVLHLRRLLYRLGDIPSYEERYACALAAYVSSLEYVSKSLAYARDQEGLPASFKAWRTESRKQGQWQEWSHVKRYLLPASVEMPFEPTRVVAYVDRVVEVYQSYRS